MPILEFNKKNKLYNYIIKIGLTFNDLYGNSFRLASKDVEDIRQEVCIAALETMKNYDTLFSLKNPTEDELTHQKKLIIRGVMWRLQKILRSTKQENVLFVKLHDNNCYEYLTWKKENAEFEVFRNENDVDKFTKILDIKLVLDEIKKTKSLKVYKVLKMRMLYGLKLNEIVKKTKLSKGQVSKIINANIVRFKELLNEHKNI